MTENIPTAQVEAVVTINKTLQDRLKQAGALINKRNASLKNAEQTERELRQEIAQLETRLAELEGNGGHLEPTGEASPQPAISDEDLARKDAEIADRDAKIADLEGELDEARKSADRPNPEDLYGPEENPLVVEAREETEAVRFEKERMESERDSLKVQLTNAEERFDERTAELRDTARDLRNQLGEVKEQRDELDEKLRKTARSMGGEDLSHQMIMSSMHAAGLEAQIIALRKEHPDSRLLQHSQKRFEDGRAKTKLRLVYDDAFDHKGSTLGITSPNQYRP